MSEAMEKLRTLLKQAEAAETAEKEERRKKIVAKIADHITWTFRIESHREDDLWQTDEVVYIRITEQITPSLRLSQEELAEVFAQATWPRESIAYLVSRKHRCVIGTSGGGYALLGSDVIPSRRSYATATVPRLKGALRDWLVSMGGDDE